ncbi:hypothetical protein GcC1_030037, partial [Golovinomyces cichoracearum]
MQVPSVTPDNALPSNTEIRSNVNEADTTHETCKSQPRQTKTAMLETRRSERIRKMSARNDDLINS